MLLTHSFHNNTINFPADLGSYTYYTNTLKQNNHHQQSLKQ